MRISPLADAPLGQEPEVAEWSRRARVALLLSTASATWLALGLLFLA